MITNLVSPRFGKVKAQGSGSSDKTMESLFSSSLHRFEMFGSFLARKKRGRLYAGSFSHTYTRLGFAMSFVNSIKYHDFTSHKLL